MGKTPGKGPSRPSGAPRLTREGVDLDAKEAEEKRSREEAQQEEISGKISAAEIALSAVFAVVRAADRARLAATELEHVLRDTGMVSREALTKIRRSRALLAGAVEMLAMYREEGNDDDI